MTPLLKKIADLGANALPNYDLIGLSQRDLSRWSSYDFDARVWSWCADLDQEINRMIEERGATRCFVEGDVGHVLWLRERLGAAQALWQFIPPAGSLIARNPEISDEASIRWVLLDWWRIIGCSWYAIWLKSAEPAFETKKKLKRKITYYADDGTAFESRVTAKKHDTDLKRKERIEKCLRRILPDTPALSWEAVVTAMVLHAGALSEALSARAAVRALPRIKRAEWKVPKRP
jgi:hypothetical protein